MMRISVDSVDIDDPFGDPWYRFSRVCAALQRVGVVLDGKRVLDLGCNQGQFVRYLLERHAVDAWGVDDWPPQEKNDPTWNYEQIDLATEFKHLGKFDVLCALEVLEHMTDTDAFLEQCGACLHDHGTMVISTPNINSLRNRIEVPLGGYPNGLEFRNLIHHVRLYNVPMLRWHLGQHGFEVVRLVGVNFLPARYLRFNGYRKLSECLSESFPQLCGNIIVIARKVARHSG